MKLTRTAVWVLFCICWLKIKWSTSYRQHATDDHVHQLLPLTCYIGVEILLLKHTQSQNFADDLMCLKVVGLQMGSSDVKSSNSNYRLPPQEYRVIYCNLYRQHIKECLEHGSNYRSSYRLKRVVRIVTLRTRTSALQMPLHDVYLLLETDE